jgi:predicted O-methyltransferase YrrM
MKWSDFLFESYHWVRHRWRSRIRHGVHSPFVFGLQNGSLKEAAMAPIPQIELRRQGLLKDHRMLDRMDLGAGSRKGNSQVITVAAFAKRSLQDEHAAKILRGLADGLQATTILELGTALGLTTAYFAFQRPHREVWSLEGDPIVAKLAQEQWIQLGIDSIRLLQCSFDQGLERPELREKSFDLVLVDGNHTYEATLRYWHLLKHRITKHGCIIFDDIYWSPQMLKAWQEIKNDPMVSLTLDYFHWGVVFIFPRNQVEHYALRFPTTRPRTNHY